jgi:hypothetical protein
MPCPSDEVVERDLGSENHPQKDQGELQEFRSTQQLTDSIKTLPTRSENQINRWNM